MKKALIWIVVIGVVLWGLSAISGSKTDISNSAQQNSVVGGGTR